MLNRAAVPLASSGTDRIPRSLIRFHALLGSLTAAIDRSVAVITVTLLGFIVCANGAEILLRGAFSSSLLWLYEVNLLVGDWLYFLGMVMVYYRHRDITLDFMLLVLRGRARPVYLIAVNAVAVVTFLIVAVYGVRLMELQLPFLTPGDNIPQALFTLPVVLCCTAIALIVVEQSIALGRTGELPPTDGANEP